MSDIPLPPNDPDAEQQLIGCVMLDPSIVKNINITPEEFYNPYRTNVWRAILAVHRAGHAPDYANVMAKLEADGVYQDAVGASLSSFVLNGLIRSQYAQDYADRIRERAGRRAIIQLAQGMASAAYDTGNNLDNRRATWITEIIKTYNLRKQAQPIDGIVRDLVKEIETAAHNPKDVYGIATGFVDFDRVTKGLHVGESFLLAGQPGMGKSLFAGQMLMQISKLGVPVVYYALEMRQAAVVRRMLSGLTKIPTARLRGGFINDDEWQGIYTHAAQVSELPFFMSDATHWDTSSLRADVSRLVSERGVRVVAIDHVGLLKDRAVDPNERDKQISQALHDIAKDLETSVVAIHTMNKTGLRSTLPGLADSSGSVKFVYDADVIAFLTEHMPQNGEQKKDHARTLSFAKYREDSPDRYLHLVQLSVTENGKPRGLPRFECMEDY